MSKVPSMPRENHRPVEATIALFAYNHEAFLQEAISSVLHQENCVLELLVLDDASRDRTFEISERAVSQYEGPHSIKLFRNNSNQGLAHQVNQAFELASTDVVIFAAGDDVSLPDRAQKMIQAFSRAGKKATCVWSNAHIVDEKGIIQGLYRPANDTCRHNASSDLLSASHNPWVLGATSAYRKEVFSAFGPLDQHIMQEDLALALRSRLLGEVIYLPEILVSYRRHGSNLYSIESQSCEAALGSERSQMNRRALRRQACADLRRARYLGRVGRSEAYYYKAIHAYRHWCSSLLESRVGRRPFARFILYKFFACNRIIDAAIRFIMRIG